MVQTIQRPLARAAEAADILPIVLKLSPLIEMDDERFAEFCSLNRDLRIERTATGELEIMAPAFSETGNRQSKITTQLEIWTSHDDSGIAFAPPAGFTLPNGAIREPDASWVPKSRLAALTLEDRDRFIPLCPDFVVELRSATDRLSVLQAKMEEYIANGARLGWLIDPQSRSVYTYRPDHDVEIITNPQTLSADPALPGFTLDLTEIWDPWRWLSDNDPQSQPEP